MTAATRLEEEVLATLQKREDEARVALAKHRAERDPQGTTMGSLLRYTEARIYREARWIVGDTAEMLEHFATQPLQGSEVERDGAHGVQWPQRLPTCPECTWPEVGQGADWCEDCAQPVTWVRVVPLTKLQRVEGERDRWISRFDETIADAQNVVGLELDQAAKTFEEWAAEEESRIAGAESTQTREVHRGIVLALRRCVEHLRSQSSSEVGEEKQWTPR